MTVKNIKNKIDGFLKLSMKDHLGKPSATRINGYLMTILIFLTVLTTLGLEVYSAVTQYKNNETYTISTQVIAVLTLILGQQALLFNLKRKNEETPFPSYEKSLENKEKNVEEI